MLCGVWQVSRANGLEGGQFLWLSSRPSAQLRTGAGTHTAESIVCRWQKYRSDESSPNRSLWLWVPASAGTTSNVGRVPRALSAATGTE
ncbi:hypothetical protein ABIB68_001452 [Bradyrhizobium sp. F1.2.2]